MCDLIFSTNIAWSIFHCKKNLARYYYKCTYVFIESTRYSYQILMKLEFSLHAFEKSSDNKFNQNPSNRSRAVYADGYKWRS